MSDQPQIPSEQHDLTSAVTGFLASHTRHIVIAAVGFLVVSGIVIVMNERSQADLEESWSRFRAAQSASDYANLASDFAGSELAVWARLNEGKALLGEGMDLQFSDRAAADSQLKKAGEAFEFVLSSRLSPPEAIEQATIGKAFLAEATSDGKMDAAIQAYEAFLARKSDSPYAAVYDAVIQDRIKALKSDSAQSFYAWFAAQNPKPEDRQQPTDGLPPGHPEIITLPEIPGELIPAEWSELSAENLPSGDEPTSAKEEGPAAEGQSGSTEATGSAPADETKSSPEGSAATESGSTEQPAVQ